MRPGFARRLDEAHARLERDRSLELESLDDIEHLAGVLVSAKRLPPDLVIRATMPQHAEAAFRDRCRAHAESAWAQATTSRRAGVRQLGPCLLAATAACAIAAASGTAAMSVGSNLGAAVLYVIAGVGVISAWVIAWMPIEEILFDWRPPARTARAYELLASAPLELAARGSDVAHTSGSR